MSDNSILIVEDNHINMKLLQVLLRKHLFDVTTAANAEEAMRLLTNFTPALILMDLQLPGMDGLTLTRHLKSDPRTQHIIIIALTAYAMKGDEEKALSAGCDGYITKPFDTRTLPTTIKQYFIAQEAKQK